MNIACIIPVRNMASTVGRAIDSAIIAGCNDIVVVDDCSTDNTPSVLKEYGDKITVWSWPRKPTDWVSAQRVVWDATKADHYIWLGADDWLMPELGGIITKYADAPVIFTDYEVVDTEGKHLWNVSQDVAQVVQLTPDEMKLRIKSNRNATETGSGSSLRHDVAKWLWSTGFDIMGPHADSIGYATAASMFGCVLIPIIGAAFTLTPTSYSRRPNESNEDILKTGGICRDWMRSVQLDEDTVKALCYKRCGVTW